MLTKCYQQFEHSFLSRRRVRINYLSNFDVLQVSFPQTTLKCEAKRFEFRRPWRLFQTRDRSASVADTSAGRNRTCSARTPWEPRPPPREPRPRTRGHGVAGHVSVDTLPAGADAADPAREAAEHPVSRLCERASSPGGLLGQWAGGPATPGSTLSARRPLSGQTDGGRSAPHGVWGWGHSDSVSVH